MTVDVKTRITVEESGAGDALNRIRDGFEDMSQARDKAQQGMTWFGQTLSTLVATQLPAAISKIGEFGRSFYDAANATDAADQALGGMITTVQGIPWDEARSQAEALGDEVDALANKTMQRTGDMRAAFASLVELGEATPEGIQRARTELEQIGTIANVLGKDTSALAMEFKLIEEGMIRSRGQMAQLLQTTGIFGDDMAKASTNWIKLDPGKRSELLAQALGDISGKMAQATPTFADYMNQISNFVDLAKEKIGEPLLRAIKPSIERLSGYLVENVGRLEELAEYLESDFGDVAEDMANEVQAAFEWITENKEQIAESIKEAWQFAKDVVSFIIENKDTIAMLAAVYLGGKFAGGVIASPVGQAAMQGGKAVYTAGAAGTGALGMGGAGLTGMAGGIAALGALAAAIVGIGLAADQATKLINEMSRDSTADADARMDALRRFSEETGRFNQSAAESIEWIKRMDEALVLAARDLGMSVQELHQYTEALQNQAEASALIGDQMRASAKLAQAMVSTGAEGVGQETYDENIGIAAEGVVLSFEAAMKMQDDAAKRYIVQQLSRSEALQTAFMMSADMTDEGFKALLEAVEKGGEGMNDFANFLREMVGESPKMAKPKFNVNFNGGQTFKIQQDFRDQDPDRIAIVFQRDIIAAATKRVQASTATPFGT